MPIRRPRTPKPSLRHLAFLEAMAETAATDPPHAGAQASFLTLRLLDHWVAFGAELAAPEAQAHVATRDQVATLKADPQLRTALTAILDSIVALQEPDAQPVLPSVHALGLLLERRGLVAQAGDVFQTVTRHVNNTVHLDLAFDSFMRQGDCLRQMGEFEWAEQAYGNAAVLAMRDRDPERVALARSARASAHPDRASATDDLSSQLASANP